MKTKYTYKILGHFDGAWIGMVPEVPGAASYAKDLNELIHLLDDAVNAIWATMEVGDKPVNAELYTSHQWTDFGGPISEQAYRFVTPGKDAQKYGCSQPVEEKPTKREFVNIYKHVCRGLNRQISGKYPTYEMALNCKGDDDYIETVEIIRHPKTSEVK